MTDQSQQPHLTRPAYRLAGAALGVLLLACGLYVAFAADTDALSWLGVALLLAFGGNLLVCAWRGRASWLSRIGPLP